MGGRLLCKGVGSIGRLFDEVSLVSKFGFELGRGDTLFRVMACGEFVEFWGVALGWFVLYWRVWND